MFLRICLALVGVVRYSGSGDLQLLKARGCVLRKRESRRCGEWCSVSNGTTPTADPIGICHRGKSRNLMKKSLALNPQVGSWSWRDGRIIISS